MPEPREPIRDPKRLRALAHPLRWKLINLIGEEETATATRCADVLGESVASCSYHLNMLAKYDFIEQAEGGQGREKPWQLTSREQSFTSEGMDLEGKLAAEAAGDAFLDYEIDAMRERMKRRDGEPEAWREPTGMSATTMYVTLEEATELRAELHKLMDKYEERWTKPELRPDGARQMRLFMSLFLNPERR
jgi:Helix-turn-helix domain